MLNGCEEHIFSRNKHLSVWIWYIGLKWIYFTFSVKTLWIPDVMYQRLSRVINQASNENLYVKVPELDRC